MDSYRTCQLEPKRSGHRLKRTGGLSRQETTVHLNVNYRLFVDGFVEMVRRLEPLVVLSYGRLPATFHELAKVVTYPTRWTNIAQHGSGEKLFDQRDGSGR